MPREMAVEDFGGEALGAKIEVVFADHHNKPDIGTGIAREWYDQGGVDLIVDVLNSAIALGLAEDRGREEQAGDVRRDRVRSQRQVLRRRTAFNGAWTATFSPTALPTA